MQDYEKLGAFYLGKVVDPTTGKVGDEPLLYDSKDLTTHGVIVGMTGSGKTGLAIGLLEEAAIDGIPAIAIDPKGDLGNLLLQFPEMRAEDLRPWVDDGDPAQVAEGWRKGLADWGQEPARIAKLRAACDVAIYTPGLSGGAPLSVLRSLDPPAGADGDPDARRERIAGAAAGLLGLLGIDADPVRSREHILIARILDDAWAKGQGVDLGALVRAIQSPAFDRVGVLDLESFYPARERSALAMQLNNLLASPGFAAWVEGEPLDVKRLLWSAEGKPRISVVSIAHLSDAERMFFVTLLLNEVVGWMRSQSGTSSLRALLYMDEVFGFFPPVANPPSKTPMLTLMKQARAFGLGVVVATQNPVDLDYKGLSNAGTWFLGRLQTERDKERVLEGLEGASAASGKNFDRAACDAMLSSLGKRVFLMNNVHDNAPTLMQTRWTLSYLRGPLTRVQIQKLAKPASAPVAAPAPAPAPAAAPATGGERPVLPTEIAEHFVAGATGTLRPHAYSHVRIHYVQAKHGVDLWEDAFLMTPIPEAGSPSWDQALALPAKPALGREVPAGATFAPLPSAAARPKNYPTWTKDLAETLYRTRRLKLPVCPELKLLGKAGEGEADFRARVQLAVRERRDAEVEKLRKKYATKVASAQEKLRRAEERVAREAAQYDQQKTQAAISVGASVLGALFGRKLASAANVGRATTAARGFGRAAREKEDIAAAQEAVELARKGLADLEFELQQQVEAIGGGEPAVEALEIPPRKADFDLEPVALVWAPEAKA
jgi:hypothetical protein